MDDRILLAGIIPLLLVSCGCILVGSAFRFPVEAIIGLLLITLPIIFLTWYILVRVENLTAGVKFQGRIIHQAVDNQALDMKRRYEESKRAMMDVQSELSRRIYR